MRNIGNQTGHELLFRRGATLEVAASAAALALTLVGCGMRVPVDGSLNPPTPQAYTVKTRAWIAPVEINDAEAVDRESIAAALSKNFLLFVRQGRYASKVEPMSDQIVPGDLLLKLRFDRYRVRRSIHPLNIPLGLLTFAMYYVFGGPASIDTVDIAGELLIQDSGGATLAGAKGAVNKTEHLTLYTMESIPGGKQDRTPLVVDLLRDAFQQLRAVRGD